MTKQAKGNNYIFFKLSSNSWPSYNNFWDIFITFHSNPLKGVELYKGR